MKKENKGFTLVELIVVIVILGILAAILVPALLGYIDKAKREKILVNARAVYEAAQATATEYYAFGVKSDQNKDRRSDKNGYWITLTNDMTMKEETIKNFPYMADCCKLLDLDSMPKFYAVAITHDEKPGMIRYVTYYDVESATVAYWDYESKTWTFKENIPKPNGRWPYVKSKGDGDKSYENGENFSSYYKK